MQRRGIFRPTTHHGTLSFGVGAVVHLVWSTYISHRRHVGAVSSSDTEMKIFLIDAYAHRSTDRVPT